MRLARGVMLCVVLFATSIYGSIVPTALTGHVVSDGRPVSGATVTATSPSLMQPRVTTTTSNGMYWLEDLPPGQYDVTFSHAGMTTLTRRAVIELARVARIDAALELNEDEDSVTSTETMLTVADTQPMSVHLTDHDLDLLPVWRAAPDAALTAADAYSAATDTLIDDAYDALPNLIGQEALQEVTVLRGALPPELGRNYSTIVARTRNGGDDLSFSLRDTLTSVAWMNGNPFLDESARRPRGDGVDHFVEAALGGRLVRDRLWFFTSGWRGGQDDRPIHNVRGLEVKLTTQPFQSHMFEALYINGARDSRVPFRAASQSTLQYLGMLTPRTTLEATASRGATTFTPSIFGNDPTSLFIEDTLFIKAAHVLSTRSGDSVLSGGLTTQDSDIGGSTTLFFNERWSGSSLIVNAGGRLERGGDELHLRPRLSVAWDLSRDGRRSLFAALSDYADPRLPTYAVQEAVAGFATALGKTGLFRVDVAHRAFDRPQEEGYSSDILRIESSYRLFERFTAGGFYEYARLDEGAYPVVPRHSLNAWSSLEISLGEHTLGLSLLQRYASYQESDGARYDTDLGFRYTIPVRSLAVTAATDVTNVFNQHHAGFTSGRALRAWIRVRR
jgi:hypothetical protein